jgi:hypothetical protein
MLVLLTACSIKEYQKDEIIKCQNSQDSYCETDGKTLANGIQKYYEDYYVVEFPSDACHIDETTKMKECGPESRGTKKLLTVNAELYKSIYKDGQLTYKEVISDQITKNSRRVVIKYFSWGEQREIYHPTENSLILVDCGWGIRYKGDKLVSIMDKYGNPHCPGKNN